MRRLSTYATWNCEVYDAHIALELAGVCNTILLHPYKLCGKNLYSPRHNIIMVVCMPKKKKATSIKIDPDLWKEVKIEAIRRNLEVSELVELALRKELKLLEEPKK